MTVLFRPEPLDGHGPVYEQIKRAVAEPILRGEWQPDTRVPSEHELTHLFRTSRMTVNRALTALAEEGLIVRRRRAGSFVAAPTSQHPVLEIHDIKAEILATKQAYRFELIERAVRQANQHDLARLGLKDCVRILAMSVRHFATDLPFAFEDRLINLEAVPAAEREPFDETPPGTWLLQHIPWTEATHRIRAVSADRILQERLDLAKGAPSLLVERRTWRSNEPVTAVHLYYPGDRHELVAQFNPRSQMTNLREIGDRPLPQLAVVSGN